MEMYKNEVLQWRTNYICSLCHVCGEVSTVSVCINKTYYNSSTIEIWLNTQPTCLVRPKPYMKLDAYPFFVCLHEFFS